MMRSDGPTCRRIVAAFLDFLNSVSAADAEGLEVAKDCLSQVFRLPDPHIPPPQPNPLLNLFSSDSDDVDVDVDGGGGGGVSKDELLGHFLDALDKAHFFEANPNANADDTASSLFHRALNEIDTSGSKVYNRKALADALKTLGNKAMQSRLYSDAVELYTCAIALIENDAVFYCNRAAAYTQMHKYNEAVKDCLKSIDINPNYSKAYSRLGLAYYGQGKYADAINNGFTKALELDPNNDAVKENIRVAELKLIEQEQRNRSQDSEPNVAGGSENQAPPPFASFRTNIASILTNLAGNMPPNQNGQSSTAEQNRGTHASFTSSASGGNTNPADIASMFRNLSGNAFQGQDSESGPEEQTHSSGASGAFSSMSFDAGTLPSDLAGMFMNMTGQGSQGQSAGGQPQGGSNVNGSNEPEIDVGADFSFNFDGQTAEELNRTFRTMMGMFSRGGQGDQQSNTD